MEKICENHANRIIEYACLSPGCNNPRSLCILCVKHNHSSCDPNYLIYADDIGKLKLIRSSLNVPEIVAHNFTQQIAKNKETIIRAFRQLKERTLKTLEFSSYDHEDVLYLNNIDKLKQNYKVSIHKDGDIIFTPKLQTDKINTYIMVRAYKENINAAVNGLIKELSMIEVDRVHQIIEPRHFIGHKLLKLTYNSENETITIRDSDADKIVNKLLIYSIPLTKTAINISVKRLDDTAEIKPDNKFVTVGIISHKTFESYRKNTSDYILKNLDALSYVTSLDEKNFVAVTSPNYTMKHNYISPGHSAVFMFTKYMNSDSKCELTDFNEFLLEKTVASNTGYYFFIGMPNSDIEIELSQNFA